MRRERRHLRLTVLWAILAHGRESRAGTGGMGLGVRVRLVRDVERYPHFIAPAGWCGTVTHVDDDMTCVRMDLPLLGAEEWDNEVQWSREWEEDVLADTVVC